ncbi:indole-3-glycerol-phosphate synthase [bacterium]|nr:indole-3-glycerol-phosphate synthase [bacterium]
MIYISILDRIVQDKAKEISSLECYRERYKVVRSRFKDIFINEKIAFIGEVKPASPVKGEFRSRDALELTVKELVTTPISAVSVLTDSHFNASIDNISLVKRYTDIPILRKDFIIDKLQVFESSFYEVDAILLIAKVLDRESLKSLYSLSISLGIEPVVEVYNLEDLEKVLELSPSIILINNRNLETFEVNIKHTEEIKRYIPDNIKIISASGISTREDIKYLRSLGVDGVLIGEAIMRASDIREKVMELMSLED